VYVTDPVLGDGTASYTPGVSRRQGTNVSYQHGGLKNLDAQTSVSQNVMAARVYDAFGNVVTSTGAWAGPFGYAGGFGYQQDASGLKLLGHRYYDPSTGRCLTRDPIKDGRNWYAYGAGESAPTTMVDPTGLVKITVYYYSVQGTGWVHFFMVITDNVKGSKTYGERWYVSGFAYDPHTKNRNAPGLRSIAQGAVEPRGSAYDDGNEFNEFVILDDQSAAEGWVNRAKFWVDIFNSEKRFYNANCNSNTLFSWVITVLGLTDEFLDAMARRRRAGIKPPVAPGIGMDLSGRSTTSVTTGGRRE
jgi:RHS repeat-associated protein